MYKVATFSGTTWQFIKSYSKWKLDENFLRFVFKEGDRELILPLKDIKNIQQVN